MGHYHQLVNLDKKEYVDPFRVGSQYKLWAQVLQHPGLPAALYVLLAGSNGGPSGDILVDSPLIGRWAGDRVAIVGDCDRTTRYPEGTAIEIFERVGTEYVDISGQIRPVLEEIFCQKCREEDGEYEWDEENFYPQCNACGIEYGPLSKEEYKRNLGWCPKCTIKFDIEKRHRKFQKI